jgi:superfamily II DNA or RNA helicase
MVACLKNKRQHWRNFIMEPIWVVDTNKSTLDTSRSLFPHQQEAVKALTEYFSIPNNGVAEHNRGLLIMPTGSGKTFTAVQWLFTEAMAKGYKIIWLVHRRELIDQASAEFMRSSPIMALYNYDKVKGISVSSQHYPGFKCAGI